MKKIPVLAFFLILLFMGEFFLYARGDSLENKTPAEIIEIAQNVIFEMDTYKVNMTLKTFGDDPQVQDQTLWYKKGGFVRIHQTGSFRKNAVVVINPTQENKIRGHLGGLLSFFVTSLPPDHSLLKGVTGDSAIMADYISILGAARQVIKKHLKSYQIIRKNYHGKEAYLIEATIDRNNLDFDFVKEEDRYRWFVLKKELILVRLERFKRDILLNTIVWSHWEKNAQVDPNFFILD